MKRHVWLKGLLFSALLATVAGGTTVFAAGTTQKNISNGEAQKGFDATAGTADANSIGEFQIEAGLLTLDRVPNLHFTKDGVAQNPKIGDIATGTQLKFTNSTVTSGTATATALDGNTDNTLMVSDFRGDETKGWNLYATVSAFTKDATHSLTGVTLNITPTIVARAGQPGVDATPLTAAIPAKANGEAGVVVDAAKNTGTLTNNFKFDGTTTLDIEAQAAQAGVYQAQVTWTLANVPKAD